MYETVESYLLANINKLEDDLAQMSFSNKCYKQVCDNADAILDQLRKNIRDNTFFYTKNLPPVDEFNTFKEWKEEAIFQPTFAQANKEMQEFIEDTLADIYQELKDF